jgi:hypothetical protein
MNGIIGRWHSAWLQITVHSYSRARTHTHTQTLVPTVTSSLTFLGSSFQQREFPFLWVPKWFGASATGFEPQNLTTTEYLLFRNSLAGSQPTATVSRLVKLPLAFASIYSWLQSPRDPWPRFLFSPRHVRVSKWGLLFDKERVGLSISALRVLHRSFRNSLSALIRRPATNWPC